MLVLSAPAGLRAASPQTDGAEQTGYCSAAAPLSADPADLFDLATWNCTAPAASLEPQRTALLFTLDPQAELPRLLISRRSQLQAVHVVVEDEDGTRRSESFAYDDLRPAMLGSLFKVALPAVTPQTRRVLVAFDRATFEMTLAQAYLATADPGELAAGREMLLMLAALCGMLLMPLMINIAFYRVLRERFVLWHSALAITLMMTVLIHSGLIVYLVDISISTLTRLNTITFGLSVAAGGMFAHSFIEPDRLNPRLRRALPWAALWSLAISVAHASYPFAGRAWQSDIYYLAFVPVLALYIGLLSDAIMRGSRAAKFQLVGWLPLIGVGVMRIGGQLVPGLQPTDAMQLFYLGCVFEVLATTLGVADRFMALKDQRDRARTEATMMERLCERDTLTGLYNRRILEERFAMRRSQGFTVMAVIDLDHFKTVNDTFGHGTGDDVLRAVARALQPDDDTKVVRMGGEEFVLLLRGRKAVERAEHRRQAITRHVAESVQLDRPVTASMGVVDAPLAALPDAAFDTIYRRADQLLYEAKTAGRNRMMCERLQVFVPRRDGDRRKNKQEAA